ncbi:MAG: DUF3488 and transglutaminase-like domain-containing protein [Cellvibrionaceae bacterium]
MTSEPLSRIGLLWLFVAILIAVLPHIQHLPLWHIPLAIVIFIWRYQMFRGAWDGPSKWMRFSMVIAAIAGILVQFRPPIGLEPMTALLIAATLLKFVELHKMRDAALLHYMALFICALNGLFYQSLLMALYILISLIIILSSMTVAYRQDSQQVILDPVKLNLKFLLQALPLAIILFLVMPRLGTLWSVPALKHSAKTGMSDTMSPGDVSKLGRSANVAFRVSFEGDIPPPNQRYWRGIVFSNFDGRTWTAPAKALLPDSEIATPEGVGFQYTVILEPTHQRWLYGINIAEAQDPTIQISPVNTLERKLPVSHRIKYDVTSYTNYSWEQHLLNPSSERQYLRIPIGLNPDAVSYALHTRQSSVDDRGYVNRVLNLYNEKFSYTLEPPVLGRNTVDDFLFKTQAGFCEHFASSFVFLMRAGGVPARVVGGYQGGELNAAENYLVVRQYDAHAWAEVWLKGEGWVRIDPTAAVAPERIESNFTDLFDNEEEFLSETPLALVKWKHIDFINQMRLTWEVANFKWHQLVLGYDNTKKIELLTRLLGGVDYWRIAVVLLAGLLAPILLAYGWMKLRKRKNSSSKSVQYYERYCQKLAKLGCERQPGEPPGDYASRVSQELPGWSDRTFQVTKLFTQLEYGIASSLFLNETINVTDNKKGQKYDSALRVLKKLCR